ncbi:helix-turn-helix domain-containing protein [Natronolimnobius baerhuensis]|uniref:Bacterio-opsin activator n=1 Tax=Natronolimnobius baerhuensis TaxID=253108 RepID=A0A202E3W9_9EURY|nr:helix-turn-helix domain-containing protein [Natronolimnobius baerhuensis]OVE82985.1 bacterio-opsin activator [Natronolimnobius baerhuensis]
MALIGKLAIGNPVGEQALAEVPEMVLEVEDIRSLADDPWTFVFWAAGDDFQTYESALDDDPTVSTYECLTALPDRRLYRCELSPEGQQHTLQFVAIDENILTIRLTLSASGIEYVGRFPSREALHSFREVCIEQNRSFSVRNLYEEQASGDDERRYGVTASQRETLLTALEQGYFEVPRETRMEDIAGELEISTSAVSAQLRRGQASLLRHTLAAHSSIATRE